jgi:hypothetical protein
VSYEETTSLMESREEAQNIDISPLGMTVVKDATSRGMKRPRGFDNPNSNKKKISSMNCGI